MYPYLTRSPSGRGGHSPLLEAALDYIGRGWAVFPLRWKEPAVPKWKHFREPENRPDEHAIREWFDCPEECVTGIAIICGAVSGGLTVRDFDDADSYFRWADGHQDLARRLPTVRTYRGYHLYFLTTRLLYRKFRSGEYRGTVGQYVAAPPSLHPVSRQPDHRFVVPLPPRGEPLPTVADPVAAGLLPASTRRTAASARSRIPRRASSTPYISVSTLPLQALVRRCLPTGHGERHDCLLELVRRLDAARLGEEHLEDAFAQWWELAEPIVQTKDRRMSWREFRDAWRRSQERRASGKAAGVLGEVMALADAMPVPAAFVQPDTLRRLYQLHSAMQVQAGSQQHFLSCHLAGELLGVSHQTAWKWQNHLRRAGILVRTRVGERRAGGKASEWVAVQAGEQRGEVG